MSKTSLFLTSLVGALPGGLCAFLMVMAFLNHAGGPTTVIKALNGSMLLIGSLLAVMPFGILVFAGPKTEKPPKAKEGGEAKSKSESGAEADSESEVAEEVEDADFEEAEAEETEAEEAGEAEPDAGEAFGESDGEEAFDESDESPVDVTDPNLEVVDAEPEDFAMTGELVTGDDAAADDVFDSGEDFEVEAEEPDDTPKKGKKK